MVGVEIHLDADVLLESFTVGNLDDRRSIQYGVVTKFVLRREEVRRENTSFFLTAGRALVSLVSGNAGDSCLSLRRTSPFVSVFFEVSGDVSKQQRDESNLWLSSTKGADGRTDDKLVEPHV